jgi:hypothetical protein
MIVQLSFNLRYALVRLNLSLRLEDKCFGFSEYKLKWLAAATFDSLSVVLPVFGHLLVLV